MTFICHFVFSSAVVELITVTQVNVCLCVHVGVVCLLATDLLDSCETHLPMYVYVSLSIYKSIIMQ